MGLAVCGSGVSTKSCPKHVSLVSLPPPSPSNPSLKLDKRVPSGVPIQYREHQVNVIIQICAFWNSCSFFCNKPLLVAMSHRKWKETDQQLIFWPYLTADFLALPGSARLLISNVTFRFYLLIHDKNVLHSY